MIPGVYENHHLLCPVHGRIVSDPAEPGRASCGCTPHIAWETVSHGEAEMYSARSDQLGVGRRIL